MAQIAKTKQQLERDAANIGIQCFNSFYFFFKTFWFEMTGVTLIDSPHIKYICDTIQSKAMPVIREEFSMETLIINVPPGSSKSTIATIAFPMWVWLHGPHLASTNVSYSARLSERHAKKARAIVNSNKWKFLFDNLFKLKYGKALEITTQNLNETVNNFKGERFNTSVDGTITGMHADFIIKDDMQDPKSAKSDTERAHCNEWDQETLTSRHKNASCFLDIIIAQRLHEEDLTGYTLNKNIRISQVCLPAKFTNACAVVPKEAEAIYTDGVLDPKRLPIVALDGYKAQMTSGPFTCQYLQAPFNLEEQAITPSMFEIIETVNDDVVWDVWIDGAFTKDNTNDPSGIDLIAKIGNDIVVKQSYDVYKELPDLVKFIKELEATKMFNKQKSRIIIEPKASGLPLEQYLINDTTYNVVLIGANNKEERKLVQEGKPARHNMIKPKAESHRIKLLKGNWNENFITQICGFPRAAHDEHVDNLGYAINHYYMNENNFLEDFAINKLEKLVTGSLNAFVTSQISGYNIETAYEENDSGDVQLFDFPYKLHKYRYICVLVTRSHGERGGDTAIVVFDRLTFTVAAMFQSNTITPNKAAKRALEMAHLYDKAKLVVVVKKETGATQSEEEDLGHIALAEIRKTRYDNIFYQLTHNNIKLNKEKEYGYIVDRSATREVFYNMKELVETAKANEVPLSVYEEIKLLERKKESGMIKAKEGHTVNAALSFSIALKVHSEMYDKCQVRKNERW